MADHVPNAYHHAQDESAWTFFESLAPSLPSFPHPLHFLNDLTGYHLFNERFQVTKFMLMEIFTAILMALVFSWVAKRAKDGDAPRGRWWNLLEALLDVVRDGIARPVLGNKEADRLLPFLWTAFFFVLISNLLGMIPFMGSPTASIWMTGSLALCSFFLFHAIPIARFGFIPYVKTMWLDLGMGPFGWPISLLIFGIELLGTVIKGTVLALRLFGNIFAGHVALATVLIIGWNAGFGSLGNTGISIATVLGAAAMSLLELLVAFLQAYVFTFLTAIFISIPLAHGEHGHDEHEHAHESGHTHGHEAAAAHAH